MAKEKAKVIKDGEPIIKAVPKISPAPLGIEQKKGWHILEKIDSDGNHLGFVQVSDRTYERSYKDRPEYRMYKKKVQ